MACKERSQTSARGGRRTEVRPRAYRILGQRLILDILAVRRTSRRRPRDLLSRPSQAQDRITRSDRAAESTPAIDRGFPEEEPTVELARKAVRAGKVVETLQDEVEALDAVSGHEKGQELDDALPSRDLARKRGGDGGNRRVVVDRVSSAVSMVEERPQALDQLRLHADVRFLRSVGFVDVVQCVAEYGLTFERDESLKPSTGAATVRTRSDERGHGVRTEARRFEGRRSSSPPAVA